MFFSKIFINAFESVDKNFREKQLRADAAYDGEEALAYLETGNYDGVILDIMMPKMDGLAVLKKIREA